MRALTLAAALLALAADGARLAAADGPDGIGFAQAEEGTWWCLAGTQQDALGCALAKCDRESNGQDCRAARWCHPAGWSGLMIVWLPEFHATQILCGMPGRQAMIAAMRATCANAPEFSRCDIVLAIDGDGREERLNETIDRPTED